MSGGGALLRNIDKLLTQVTGVPCHVAENPSELRRPGHRAGPRALRLLQEVAGPADLMRGRARSVIRAPRSPVPTALRLRHRSARRAECHSPMTAVRRSALPCGRASTASRRRTWSRRLTHLAITDHDRIDVALEARDAGAGRADGHRRRGGQDRATAISSASSSSGRSRRGCRRIETIAAAREQGGLVGIPHPFDRMRGSLLRDAAMEAIAPHVDWVETHNARLVGHGNERGQAFAREHGLPGVAVSDAHSILEIGGRLHRPRRRSVHAGRPARRARPAELVPGRASYVDPAVDAGRQGRQARARQRPDPAGRGR